MKFYIPTTTLNFNNILSSESISPGNFFKTRGFGYPRWFDIPENDYGNCIVLYSALHKLVREDHEMEDHPLVVEIDSDEQFREIEPGIYIVDKTIYLNPWNTRFIFSDEKDITTVLSLSNSSMETKLIRLYQKKFVVCPSDAPFPTVDKKVPIELNQQEIEHDKVINRLKGLLYGYYIGALLSVEQSKVESYNILNDLHDSFASILSAPTPRNLSSAQEVRIEKLLTRFMLNKEGCTEEEMVNKVREVFFDVFKKRELKLDDFCPKPLINALKTSPSENNQAIAWVKKEMVSLRDETEQGKRLLSPDDSEIIIIDKKLHTVAKTVVSENVENELFKHIVNYIITDEKINGKISAIRQELADKFTTQAKELLGDGWGESPIRNFMNQLRRHVRGEEFSENWANGVLSSLAAVVLKGDDWETLLNFMKKKGMTDYKLAYALYGIINGFANLNRDFTDLLLNNDVSYVASVYREFHGQLHDKKIEPSSESLDNEQAKRDSVSRTFKDGVMEHFESVVKKGKRNQDKLREELASALEKMGNSEDGYEFVRVLSIYPMWKPKSKAWKEMQQKFCPNYESIRASESDGAIGSLFATHENDGDVSSENASGALEMYDSSNAQKVSRVQQVQVQMNATPGRKFSIIDDDRAIELIKRHLESYPQSTRVVALFKRFQKEYRDGGFYYRNPEEYPRNNEGVITHFYHYCFKRNLNDTQRDREIMGGLKSYLLKHYNG